MSEQVTELVNCAARVCAAQRTRELYVGKVIDAGPDVDFDYDHLARLGRQQARAIEALEARIVTAKPSMDVIEKAVALVHYWRECGAAGVGHGPAAELEKSVEQYETRKEPDED